MSDRNQGVNTRLATYGTLAPGQPNHDQIADLNGHWRQGTVYGRLVEAGWGATLGFPGLVLDPQGSPIRVHLFEAADLPERLPRLDAFEGPGYQRIVTQVQIASDEVDAWIYVVRAEAESGPSR